MHCGWQSHQLLEERIGNHPPQDTADIKNYSPISLLPVTYKVFSQILLRRMLGTMEQHQPASWLQSGFLYHRPHASCKSATREGKRV